jgi:predicted ATPase
MIERLRLVNFKSHADTTIAPGRLTALVGPNGAGKTGVLQALYMTSQLVAKSVEETISPDINTYKAYFQSLIRSGQSIFSIELSSSEQDTWGASISMTDKSPGPDIWARVRDSISGGSEVVPVTYIRPNPLEYLQGRLHPGIYFKPVGTRLSEAFYSPDVPPLLGMDGAGLASVVSYLKGNDRFEPVLAALQAIVPAVKAVRIEPAKVRVKENRSIKIDDKDISYESDREMSGQALVFDFVHARNISASQVSEGTLMALALLTLLHSPECPSLVLIDDIETALHPKAQRELVVQLRKLLDLRPELQILFTTHSVYMVDGLQPEEVWGLAIDEQGISHVARLSEAPNLDRWRGVLSTGELWDAEGEDWIITHGTQQSA